MRIRAANHWLRLGITIALVIASYAPAGTMQYVMPIDAPTPPGIAFDLVCADRFDGEIFWRGLWVDYDGGVHAYSGPDSARMHADGGTLTSAQLWEDRFRTMDTIVSRIPKESLDSMIVIMLEAKRHPMTGLFEHSPYVHLTSYSAYPRDTLTGKSQKLLLYLDAGNDRIRAGKPSRQIQMWLWGLWQQHWNGVR